jgi:hypothetical protein
MHSLDEKLRWVCQLQKARGGARIANHAEAPGSRLSLGNIAKIRLFAAVNNLV